MPCKNYDEDTGYDLYPDGTFAQGPNQGQFPPPKKKKVLSSDGSEISKWQHEIKDEKDEDDCELPVKHSSHEKVQASLLCEALALLEENDLLSAAGKELRQWYKSHEECEEDRVRLEAAEKLSARERRLLGIDLTALKKKAK